MNSFGHRTAIRIRSDRTEGQASQQSARIMQEVHDEPHIEGSRITVGHIDERVHGRGLRPDTVADRHDLDIADVYRALAYYHDHPEEMAEVEQQREETIRSARERAGIGPLE